MISKPQGYDMEQEVTWESRQLPAGCYVCVVKQVSMGTTQNGDEQINVLFDIAEGEHKGFYQSQFNSAKTQNQNATWKGVHKQKLGGTSLKFFKGLITAIEKSNNVSFPWGVEGNEKFLTGKKFGAVMGREQFFTDDGKKLFSTKIFQVRSLEGLKDAKVPEDKLLPEGAAPAKSPQYGPADKDGFMNIPDGIYEELPFM
ncbi:hypothetical protein [uncultured Robinsoniella sp.]|uniref:hypothetical protein n=1 Tax=uncultured Robinsoniella sp. TaxID=904190 RepID=UPI00374EDD6E